MSNSPPQGIFLRKTAELFFAVALLVFGIIMIVGAREMETGWGSSGPEAGYFPLRIGLLIVVAASAIFMLEFRKSGNEQTLLKSRQAAYNMARFAVPLIVLTAIVPWIGLYLAAILYLLFAIGIIGKISLVKAFAISLLVPISMFVLFEFIFRTPLPKGPLGPFLGML